MATPNPFIETIQAEAPELRHRDYADLARPASTAQLLKWCDELDAFWRDAENLYHRVRAQVLLAGLHRYILPERPEMRTPGRIPAEVHGHILARRFARAHAATLAAEPQARLNDALCSALARVYADLALQNLADQVSRSVRSCPGNRWMFRTGHAEDHPLVIRRELREPTAAGTFPILTERTAVRMDLTHSCWSDIFFLGMDFPECARVLNISIDLAVRGSGQVPAPPVEAWLRVIDQPVVRLVSIDLQASAEIGQLEDIFDFARDYLGLLKAALIASGMIPPGMEGSKVPLRDVLAQLCGPGRGLELVSRVRNIPKGSRLAVSTNLLAACIAACMRATGQTGSLTGALTEEERRTVAARAILGEWLGGSGGGWQDSGGVWPGIKAITGELASPGAPEHGVSRGALLPRHRILGEDAVSRETREALQRSLILVHGGMAQNVGPILEMVSEKYQLRETAAWAGRQESIATFDRILEALRAGDIRGLGRLTTEHFRGPLQTVIPWASNHFTEELIRQVEQLLGTDFWGFWMLGGMSGGGMGFIVAPERQEQAKDAILAILRRLKDELRASLPFAMDPVVYDFAINERGTWAELQPQVEALLPPEYYLLCAPDWLRQDPRTLGAARRQEISQLRQACHRGGDYEQLGASLLERLFPAEERQEAGRGTLEEYLTAHGFDAELHESIRRNLRAGRIGLAQNRLPLNTRIEDAAPGDVRRPADPSPALDEAHQRLRDGRVAILTLAAGAGSRWTQGAGVVKALHPFAKLGGRHRTFLEVHLAKGTRLARAGARPPVHCIGTSYLTHEPIAQLLERERRYGYPGEVRLSPGRSIGLRLVPTLRDLRFAWEETAQQVLDAQKEKMRGSVRQALMQWAQACGEAADYRDNLPLQCLHPVGHAFEVPNLLLNGTLHALLQTHPEIDHLLVHNIDTLGADLDPRVFAQHLESGAPLSYEVITRRLEDHGGGLARVDGRLRLVEGLALPREEDGARLSYYNTLTTWVTIDAWLARLGLDRSTLGDAPRVRQAVRAFVGRLPTYVTLKEVKKRWGAGQEDILPVLQFEKLWGDLSALDDLPCAFIQVDRLRGQQLKDIAQLDGWVRDGSASKIAELCGWAG